jgi:L-ascorbate metabolism protein UlaG (beta-lactamase superfamily)
MEGVTFKWLGISGVELNYGGETILIDPVFSRISFPRAVFCRIRPDIEAVRARMAPCGHIFITHSHYDHLMDAPLLSELTGAVIHGSANTLAVARACGAPEAKLAALAAGKTVRTDHFDVTALPASHIRLPGFGYGALGKLRPPLRARRYRMDESFAFLICASGFRLLVGPGLCLGDPGPVDLLACDPIYLRGRLAEYVGRIRPKIFIPIHWEDFFRKAEAPPAPGRVPGFPPRRIDMEGVRRQAEALGVGYLQMERGREYTIMEILK